MPLARLIELDPYNPFNMHVVFGWLKHDLFDLFRLVYKFRCNIYIYIYISLIEIVERRYLKRSVNSAARTIVREVILCVIYKVWVEKISNCICGIVSRDFYIPNWFVEFLIKVSTFI
jgi:hypothetical protein